MRFYDPDDVGSCGIHAYENRASASAALRRMPRWHKGQGLHLRQCRAGHWHLVRRLRRPQLAWRA